EQPPTYLTRESSPFSAMQLRFAALLVFVTVAVTIPVQNVLVAREVDLDGTGKILATTTSNGTTIHDGIPTPPPVGSGAPPPPVGGPTDLPKDDPPPYGEGPPAPTPTSGG